MAAKYFISAINVILTMVNVEFCYRLNRTIKEFSK